MYDAVGNTIALIDARSNRNSHVGWVSREGVTQLIVKLLGYATVTQPTQLRHKLSAISIITEN